MNEQIESELPQGWAKARLVDLIGSAGLFCDGDWVESKDQDPDGDVRLIQLADVGDGHYRDRSNRFLTRGRARELRCTFLSPNDLLVARMPDPLGRACVFPGDKKLSVTVVDVCVVRPNSPVSIRWLMHQLNTPNLRQRVASLQSGSTRKRISRANLAKIPFPLPPQPEQQRIADRLDELLSDLESAVAALERVKAKLALYRASILKAAVEGTMTAEWRERHPNVEPASELLARILVERRRRWEEEQLRKFNAAGKEPPKNWRAKYKEPVAPQTAGLPSLPGSWCWATWSQVGFSQNGRPFPSSEYQTTGAKLLRPGNLYANGTVGWTERNTRSMPARYADQSPDLIVRGGELVINLTAQSLKEDFLGRVCITSPGEYCLLNQRLARLTPVIVSSNFMLWIFKSPFFRQFVAGLNTGSLIQHMFTSQLDDFVFPLPTIDEQEAIVEAVEDQLSIVDHTDIEISVKLKNSQALRQAILRHAFSGKLVPQDPNDEPASELLKRIAAERENRARDAAEARASKRPRA